MRGTFRLLGIFVLLAGGFTQAGSAAPASWTVDLDHGTGNVEFRATGHPSALRILGKGGAPRGSFVVNGNKIQGTALFDLTSLDTGISMRNRHMKEKYLETEKYKDAKLTLVELALPAEMAQDHFEAKEIPFTGRLLLHGVEKPVTGTAKVERKGDTVSIVAQFGLKISDFQIAVPSFAGITMADDVQVTVSAQAPSH